MPARINGNREGLTELRDTIDKAIIASNAVTLESAEDCLFASDGEGYSVRVECHNDEWGCYAPKDSYWNKEESNPQYIMLERTG